MTLHPLFQLITDNFREIPEKIATASVTGIPGGPKVSPDLVNLAIPGGAVSTPDNAGNHGGDSSEGENSRSDC